MSMEEESIAEVDSKCGQCKFQSKNRTQMNEHVERCHDPLGCLTCGSIFPNMESLTKHKKKHQAEHKTGQDVFQGNNYLFKCTTCKVAFKSHKEMMDHMSNVHLTESQHKGAGLLKYSSLDGASNREDRPPMCHNGDECRFHKQHRCNFYHALPPQQRQQRRPRQAPSSQWKSMHSRHQAGSVQQQQGHQD